MGLIIQTIDPSHIDLANYLPSLLNEAMRCHLISENNLHLIEMNLSALFKKRMEKFTSKKSSSLPEETAENIFSAVMYTISIELQRKLQYEEQIKMLTTVPMEELLLNGHKKVTGLMSRAKLYYSEVIKTTIDVPHQAYKDTINIAIPQFFKKYDMEYGANDTAAMIDYPLADDKMDTSGIQYILIYLKKLLLENRFCSRFPTDLLISIFESYNQHYQSLIFNMFEVVLTNVIGCMLLSKPLFSLVLNSNDCYNIQTILSKYNIKDYQNLKTKIYDRLSETANISDEFGLEYLKSVINNIIEQMKISAGLNRISVFFTTVKQKAVDARLEYTDGKLLDDDTFRKIYEERSCWFISDKIKILKENIHSIKDLSDILDTDYFREDEFLIFFNTLGIKELALLIFQNILFDYLEGNLIDVLTAMQLKTKWHIKLCEYLKTLSQDMIDQISANIIALSNLQ